MGQLLERMTEALASFRGGTPTRIVMLGLDAAGKTTILYKVKLNEIVCTIPTIGFNVETLTPIKGLTFTVWDVGGQKKIRDLWRHHLQNTDGLLFIVDSADTERMEDAREELFNVVNCTDMTGVPVLVVANKQDLPGAASTSEIAKKLGLLDMRDRKWHVQGACATNGDGVYEAMQEMARLVRES